MCKQLAQGCYLKAQLPGLEPAIFKSQVQRRNLYTTEPMHMQTIHMLYA